MSPRFWPASAAGYPGDYRKGDGITGLDEAAASEGCAVFHAGTVFEGGKYRTVGGRVLCVTGQGADLLSALAHAYSGMSRIHFDGMHYRRDIAARMLRNS